MTGKSFVDLIRLYTRTNSTTLTNSDVVLLANARLENLSQAIMDADEDIFVQPMKTNLIAGRREYPLPQSLLSRIKYVEAKFDGTNFIHLDELDLNRYRRMTDEASILSNFSNNEGNSFYDINRKSLILYSGVIIDVALGLKLWANTFPAPLDTAKLADNIADLSVDPTVTTHGVPREFHELWARGVSIDYKSSREKPIPLTERELNYKADLKTTVISLRHGNQDRSVIATIPPSSNRGNNGANY